MKEKNSDLDFDFVTDCLSNFIRNHGNDASLQEFSLNEASLGGKREQEREDLWVLGDWVIQGSPRIFEAYWSYDFTLSESVRVIVNIEKKGNKYIVVDWKIEETF